MSFLTFLSLIAERYITSSQGRPQLSVGRPVDRVGRPWPTRPKPKAATGGDVKGNIEAWMPSIGKSYIYATTWPHSQLLFSAHFPDRSLSNCSKSRNTLLRFVFVPMLMLIGYLHKSLLPAQIRIYYFAASEKKHLTNDTKNNVCLKTNGFCFCFYFLFVTSYPAI